MKIIKYRIIAKESSYDMEMEINKCIKEGWQPLGSPQISVLSSVRPYAILQAIVQYAIDETVNKG
jgi:Domain of unknown function (DUF1737)